MPCLINMLKKNMERMKNKIKIQRAVHNLTQEELAEAVGVTRQTIIAIERNKYVPSLLLAYKIARYFNLPMEEIFSFK